MMRIAGIVCLLLVFAGFLFADDLMELKDQSGATKFKVDPNGNVGVGTTTPLKRFHVNGGGIVAMMEESTANTTGINSILSLLRTSGGDMTDGFGVGIRFDIQDNGGVPYRLANIQAIRDGADNTGALLFKVDNAGTQSEMMRIKANGYVGIGTSGPTQPLDLSGNMAISGIGRRVIADFSNAAHANRFAFQTSTANSHTLASVIPSGTGNIAGWTCYSTSNPDDASFFQMRVTEGATCAIDSRKTGTRQILPIVFQLGGIEKMRLTTDGLVGIGTPSPSAMLDVNDTIQASNNGGKIQIYNTNATTGTLNALTDIDVRTGGVARITVKNSGNIGIGTSNPAQKLHIYGTADLGNAIHIDAQGVTGAQQASLNFLTKGDGTTGLQQATTKGWHLTARGDAWTTTTDRNDISLSFWDGTAWKTPMHIDSVSGYVGIGTTTPTAWGGVDPKLHIYGQYGGLVQEGSVSLKKWQTYVNSAGSYTIADASAGQNRLSVDSLGNVGIGISNPGFQLQLSTDSAAKPSGGSWTNSSDERLKKDIRAFEDGLETVKGIRPVYFKFNGLTGLPDDGKENIGVVAQEIAKVAPYTVGTYKAKLNDTDAESTELLSFNASALTFVLVNAVKELDVKNKDLRKENDELKKKVDDFESRLKAIEEKLAK